MNHAENCVNVAYLNCVGQTGMTLSKQLQIQDFLKHYNIDILHLQETFIEDDTFSTCSFISTNFIIIHNNSHNRYGTATLVKSSLTPDSIVLHESGRVILFNI